MIVYLISGVRFRECADRLGESAEYSRKRTSIDMTEPKQPDPKDLDVLRTSNCDFGKPPTVEDDLALLGPDPTIVISVPIAASGSRGGRQVVRCDQMDYAGAIAEMRHLAIGALTGDAIDSRLYRTIVAELIRRRQQRTALRVVP